MPEYWINILSSAAAWLALGVLVVCGFYVSHELSKKLPNTRNNLNPNEKTFPSRLKLYFIRHLTGYLCSSIFLGVALYFIIRDPSLFLSREKPVLITANGGPVTDNLEVTMFLLDQALKGVAYDILEVYKISFTSLKLAEDTLLFRALLVGYRLVVSSFGLFMLLTVLDYLALKLNLPLGKSEDGKKKRLNLSGLARKGVVSWEPAQSSKE